ncbi:hypothetical protein RJ55_04543 [Drechmeria coniospora]|nr:hypothetical protein RJ55_04543 [Drechmeria coniospora]
MKFLANLLLLGTLAAPIMAAAVPEEAKAVEGDVSAADMPEVNQWGRCRPRDCAWNGPRECNHRRDLGCEWRWGPGSGQYVCRCRRR